LGHVALCRNHVTVRRLRESLLNRVPRLQIEVLDDLVRNHRGELKTEQHASLHVVRVVAARETLRSAWRNRNPAIPLAILPAALAVRHCRATAASSPAATR